MSEVKLHNKIRYRFENAHNYAIFKIQLERGAPSRGSKWFRAVVINSKSRALGKGKNF